MSEYLPAVIVETGKVAKDKPASGKTIDAVVIWLHGLGADGHDFEAIVPQLNLPEDLSLRFIFPHAPVMPVTMNNGMEMPAWFDVTSLNGGRSINSHQLLASSAAVHKLIDRELAAGIPSDRIILAGFSQGAAVTYQAALSYDKPLGGMMCLSGFFPTAEAVTPHPANHGLPILVCHGVQDQVLNISLATRSVEALKQLGFHPEYLIYPMAHSVCGEEIKDISNWLRSILGRPS